MKKIFIRLNNVFFEKYHCPYCGFEISKEPVRRFKCPSCKQQIYIQKIGSSKKLIDRNDYELELIRQQKEMDKIGAANNKASFESALDVEGVKKVWMTTSDNPRDSHKRYQELGPVDMNYEYAPGLKFPGDPNCKDPDETYGCHCVIIYETD
jgi:hypothetical protein